MLQHHMLIVAEGYIPEFYKRQTITVRSSQSVPFFHISHRFLSANLFISVFFYFCCRIIPGFLGISILLCAIFFLLQPKEFINPMDSSYRGLDGLNLHSKTFHRRKNL